ncbi:uncharacterized protein PRCAT00001533001 [Priceomyces carsonii]|uniref:uncharacterized protein n=1 Tax=Priceomyces carsonii TaxID=28549 RepID=UPI002ED98C4D|nr:unnamed protein product [Priceomyces carsonii]
MITRSISKRFFSYTRSALNTLALIESSGSEVTPASLSAISAASKLGDPIIALVVGSEGRSVATRVTNIPQVSKVLLAKDANYNHYIAEDVAPLIKDIMEKNSEIKHFIIPNSAAGKSILPRVGALLDVQPISDVIKVISKNEFVRPIYAGNALATVKSNDKLILASIRGSSFPPAETEGGKATVEEITSTSASPEHKAEFVSENLVKSERPELGSASIVVAGGRGLKNKETFDRLIDPLATKLHAAIGASRAAVDSGFCDNSLQVGQTGKIVAPDLYLAIGISGAIQHLAGMKDSKLIAAINKDPDAPIFKLADVGLVADLEEAIPELTSKI